MGPEDVLAGAREGASPTRVRAHRMAVAIDAGEGVDGF